MRLGGNGVKKRPRGVWLPQVRVCLLFHVGINQALDAVRLNRGSGQRGRAGAMCYQLVPTLLCGPEALPLQKPTVFHHPVIRPQVSIKRTQSGKFMGGLICSCFSIFRSLVQSLSRYNCHRE